MASWSDVDGDQDFRTSSSHAGGCSGHSPTLSGKSYRFTYPTEVELESCADAWFSFRFSVSDRRSGRGETKTASAVSQYYVYQIVGTPVPPPPPQPTPTARPTQFVLSPPTLQQQPGATRAAWTTRAAGAAGAAGTAGTARPARPAAYPAGACDDFALECRFAGIGKCYGADDTPTAKLTTHPLAPASRAAQS